MSHGRQKNMKTGARRARHSGTGQGGEGRQPQPTHLGRKLLALSSAETSADVMDAYLDKF
eukprot:UN4421